MLEHALQSDSVRLLSLAAVSLGFLHTVLGPDHYVPFVMMSRAERWSRRKTLRVALLSGLGHVGSSVAVGFILALIGASVSSWEGTFWARLHEWRGELTAWALMGVGAAYLLWALVRSKRNSSHVHFHFHEEGDGHFHDHDHSHPDHMHLHFHPRPHAHAQAPLLASRSPRRAGFTPWLLFAIFVFGPCESLIPLMLSGFAVGGVPAMTWIALLFSASTVITLLFSVAALLAGVRRVPLGFLEKHAGALAGLSLIACGASIRFLGL